jgi:hypothetical protein
MLTPMFEDARSWRAPSRGTLEKWKGEPKWRNVSTWAGYQTMIPFTVMAGQLLLARF